MIVFLLYPLFYMVVMINKMSHWPFYRSQTVTIHLFWILHVKSCGMQLEHYKWIMDYLFWIHFFIKFETWISHDFEISSKKLCCVCSRWDGLLLIFLDIMFSFLMCWSFFLFLSWRVLGITVLSSQKTFDFWCWNLSLVNTLN